MTATKLQARRVGKPWGRRVLGAGFADCVGDEQPVGEVWFEPCSNADPLMAKYLFTSERLSIQVHPDDTAAHLVGYPRGKDEAWIIVAAEPDATIALGPKRVTSRAALAAAAHDGSIADLLDWRRVAAGDTIYSPAGTVHALGAGLTLIEIQQNVDLTYRLYDYGSTRSLHLEAGIAVANLNPLIAGPPSRSAGPGRTMVAAGAAFSVEVWTEGTYLLRCGNIGCLLVPMTGSGTIDGEPFQPGECWSVSGDVEISLGAATTAVFAWPAAAAPVVERA